MGDDGGTGRRKKRTGEEVGRAALPDKPDRADSQKEKKLTCNSRRQKGKERKKRSNRGVEQRREWIFLQWKGREPGGTGGHCALSGRIACSERINLGARGW